MNEIVQFHNFSQPFQFVIEKRGKKCYNKNEYCHKSIGVAAKLHRILANFGAIRA